MTWSLASALALGVVVMGCSLQAASPPVGEVDEVCVEHADPVDCQAAFDTAMTQLDLDLDAYELSVQPIACGADGCRTRFAAYPDGDGECRASYEAELARSADGAWRVESFSHGDPPCAFE